jgi:hypothetical protein
MHHRRTALRAISVLVLASLVGVGAGACGTAGQASGDPGTLLSQTFGGTHKVSSGKLNLTLTIDPSGSSTLTTPITISFGGPFQTRGQGKLPASNFTLSANAMGQRTSLGILSTGTTGYVTFQGTSYQLPAATFQKLESSFAQLAASPGATNGSGTLAKLGIQPRRWLTHPTIVGTETVGGAQTTHIHAGVNVPALLSDLNTLLGKASSLGVSGTGAVKSGLSAATRRRIAAEVRNPSVDVWTGTSDRTVRRLAIALTLPVTGATSTQHGGMGSADIGLTMQYSDLNQPQTITAPATVRPYSEFQSKVAAFVQSLQGAAGGMLGGSGGASGGGSTGAGAAGSTASPSASAASSVQKYSQCIQAAGGDVAKMQKCASFLSSGG